MKKMRRLIPAFAMLMVAAIMLSTASFAWFTMGTDVTASGMQIQARADSTLVISEAPLTYDTGLPSVDFKTAVTKLYPMHYINNEWSIPKNSVGINTTTGTRVDDEWKALTITTGENGNVGQYYIEKDLYIASAGAAMQNKAITLTLTAPVTTAGSAHRAYAAAIYVIGLNEDGNNKAQYWADNAAIPVNEKPDYIIYVDQSVTEDAANGRHTITLPGGYSIPSIMGVGEQNEQTTGFKIVVRFYVDGELKTVGDEKIKVTTGYTYESAAGKTYSDATMYYVVDTAASEGTEATYKPAVASSDMVSGTSTVPSGWFTRAAVENSVNYNFIRTDDVPAAGSALDFTISTADYVAPEGN